MALYKHVPDKEALLDEVVAAVYSTMTIADPAEPWPDRVRHSATELRRVALAHPHLLVRVVTNPPATLAVQQRIDSILGALREGSTDDTAAVGWFWMFVSYLSGALLAETAALRDVAPVELGSTPPASCPVLAALSDELAACEFGVEYERGVDAIIELVGRSAPDASPRVHGAT